jgi:rfaE bifunctional protein kinase chain/domain
MPAAAESLARYEGILRRFPATRVGVIGDFLADRYVLGAPSRLSREAPVLILRWEGEILGPGGAANSAANLLALGARVACVGVMGDDESGRELRGRFEGQGADVSGLALSRTWSTILKTRILAGDPHRSRQQVIRVDREPDGPPPEGTGRALLAAVRRLNPKVDAWLVSDYGYGTVTQRLYRELSDGPGGARRVVVVDSRHRAREFHGATALTPNEEEAAEAAGMPIRSAAEAAAAGEALLRATESRNVLVTRGNQGLALFSAGEKPLFVPASGGDGEITDANGAGDTVAAALTLVLAAGGAPVDAARLANHAGGVVVMKPGAATLTRQELLDHARSQGTRPPAAGPRGRR